MTDWAPQVVRIEKVEKHPDADSLEICSVLGDYPVITKLGEYKEGDIAGYISIDSIVPDEDFFYFLCPKAYQKYEENGEIKQKQVGPKYPLGSVPERYRIIRAKKIRGIYSQGMLVKLAPWIIQKTPLDQIDEALNNLPQIGDSIVDLIGLKKWEEEVDDNVSNKKSRGTNAAPAPKGWSIPFYDLESIRKYLSYVEGEQDIILTEKINGSNSSFCWDGEKLVIKSRNFYKKDDPDDMWVDAAIRYNLKEKLSQYPMIAFFAECAGQVKSFRYDAEIIGGELHSKLYFFDAFDVKAGRYLNYDDFASIIDGLGLERTPILYRGPWLDKATMYAYAEGMSVLNPKTIKEGWVLSLGKERFEPRLNGRLKLKLIGEGYNLSK